MLAKSLVELARVGPDAARQTRQFGRRRQVLQDPALRREKDGCVDGAARSGFARRFGWVIPAVRGVQVDADAQAHLVKIEGLDDVVHRALDQTEHTLLGQGGGRQEDQGNFHRLRLGLEQAARGNAIANRHVNIHQDQIGLDVDGLLDTIASVFRHVKPIALAAQVVGEQVSIFFAIIHH